MSLKDYERLQQIGSGGFGDAYLVALKSDKKKKFVLKEMTFSGSDEKKDCLAEVDMLRHLNHPHIVAFHDSFSSRHAIYLLMEYCAGGDLAHFLKDQNNYLSEQRITSWTLQILLALQYLHERRPKPVLHRDMKPGNIFITENRMIKIGDFGVSRELDHVRDLATTVCGTPLYLAPEVFRQQPYDHTCDIWSLGCCVYEMMTLKTAINPLLLAMLNIVTINQMPTNYSKGLVDIVQQMLSIDASIRPSATDCINLVRDLHRARPDSPSPGHPPPAAFPAATRMNVPVDSLLLYPHRPQPGAGQASRDEEEYDFGEEMDETLKSEPVPIKTPAWFLRKHGYMFNKKEELVHVETGDRFKYEHSSKKSENEERYQEIARAVTEYIYELLEKELRMYRIHLPLDYAAGEPWTFVFATSDIFSNPDKLMILIGGAGPIRAGIWSRKAVINDSIEAGSQISLIREAASQGYAVLLLNQNQTYIEVDRCKIPVRHNRNEMEHTLYVWDNLVLKNTKARNIAIMTHSEGADIATKLAIERKESFAKLVFGVALCSPRKNDSLQSAPKEIVDLFATHSKIWVASKEPLDEPIKKSVLSAMLSKQKSFEHSAGDTRPEWTAFTSKNSAFIFLREQYEQRRRDLVHAKVASN